MLAYGSPRETDCHNRRLPGLQHNLRQRPKQASKFLNIKTIHSENLGNITNLVGLRLDMMTQLFLPALGSLCGDFFRGGVPILEMTKHRAGLFNVKEKKVKSEL